MSTATPCRVHPSTPTPERDVGLAAKKTAPSSGFLATWAVSPAYPWDPIPGCMDTERLAGSLARASMEWGDDG
jgi:hypothetical protein